jgi:uncharacterized protein (DUF1778 family)
MATADFPSSGHSASDRQGKQARLSLRVTQSQVALIKRAAEEQDKSVTDFVIGSAAVAAAQVLSDRRRFVLEEASWEVFDALLDRPAVFKPRLAELLAGEDKFVD